MSVKHFVICGFAALVLSACSFNELGVSLTDPSHPPGTGALMRMAKQAESAGRDENAAALYRQAHELHPFDSAPLTAWGFLANRVGAHDQAIDIFEKALAVDGKDRDARRGLANALVNMDRPQEALTHYEGLIAQDPEDYRAWNGKGVTLDLLGEHAAAQESYREGLAAAPENPSLANNLGLSLALDGQFDEAIETLNSIASGDIDMVTARQNLALAYGLAGRDNEAARAAGRDLDTKKVDRNLNYYRAARAARVVPASLTSQSEAAPVSAPKTAPTSLVVVEEVEQPGGITDVKPDTSRGTMQRAPEHARKQDDGGPRF
jgi:Flp pilus assembly protein TadD